MRSSLSARAKVVLYGLLCVLCLPFVFPAWWMVTSSFKPIGDIFGYPPSLLPGTWQLSAYRDVFTLQPFARQYLNSLYIAAIVTVGTVAVSALAGYAFARIRFRGANVLFLVILAGLLVPSEATIVPLFQLFRSLHLVDTHWPLILVPVLGAPSVLATFIMRQFFIALPDELEQAACLDGLGRFGMFWRVALPLSRPALAAVTIFTFLQSWNLYLEPIVYLSTPDKFTLPQALTQYVDSYGGAMWNVQLAASSLTAVPMLIVFVIAQRQFIQGLAHTGITG
ncbi:carbohydrate ABC transporter permease [Solihabitans fulvus]|uniref:Carbohydrate ABC transporter permease n=1 Tax=Solihabitans fulvus TaxID=1892852 RepID=A0A5B2XD54_9PSEU|nr:carbohydrate ABC transporter permease [Solihabitans fulvus]KAA2261114.1 carbohydrate ABC transporter permease [Solihabitans fulvus]